MKILAEVEFDVGTVRVKLEATPAQEELVEGKEKLAAVVLSDETCPSKVIV